MLIFRSQKGSASKKVWETMLYAKQEYEITCKYDTSDSNSSVGIVTRSWTGQQLRFLAGVRIVCTTMSGQALQPTQPPIQWTNFPGAGVEFKNAGSYTSTPSHVFMAWIYLYLYCIIHQWSQGMSGRFFQALQYLKKYK